MRPVSPTRVHLHVLIAERRFWLDISQKTRQWVSGGTLCTDSTTAASQPTAELIPGTELEHFPNTENQKKKKTRPDRSPSQQLGLLITTEAVLRSLSHTMHCEIFLFHLSCEGNWLPLCLYCDTILRSHYMSNKASPYNGCHGHNG